MTIYVNARQVFQHRMTYIAPSPGAASGPTLVPKAINAFIGTPPGALRKQSRLCWRLAGTHLVEDALTPEQVAIACANGPAYTGSYQTALSPWSNTVSTGGEKETN